VPQSPDPISGFPDPGPIPLAEDFPCPRIVVGPQAQGIQIDDVLSCGAQGAGTFIVELIEKECCGYEMDFKLEIPCPIVGPQTVIAAVQIVDAGLERAVVKIEQADCAQTQAEGSNPCDFAFELEIDFPCPSPLAGEYDAVTTIVDFGEEKGKLTLTKISDCGFDIDLEIDFPCPQITKKSPSSYPNNTYVDDGQQKAILHVEETGTCGYEFDLQVEFPCPKIETTTYGPSNTSWATTGVATLTFTKAAGSASCAYTPELDIQFPCPSVGAQTEYGTYNATYVDGPAGTAGTFTIELTKSSTPGECEFWLFDAEVRFPCPVLTPETVNATTSIATSPN
jgi:hypothetical protein